MTETSTILHVPHSSTFIPPATREQFQLDDASLDRELLRMTDHFTLELFSRTSSAESEIVRSDVSRLVVDVERFDDDALEIMASRGMGVLYNRTSDGRPLRRPLTDSERNELLAVWYRPHHNRLTQVVRDAMDSGKRVVIVDAHSFPAKPLPYELDQRTDRPYICIGTDAFHTPETLLTAMHLELRDLGYSVAVNAPFSGALVPMAFYQKDPRVHSIMLEVNRSLYMNEETGERRADFAIVAERVQRAYSTAIERWSVMAPGV
jgi:N-formylglutamate deformylase